MPGLYLPGATWRPISYRAAAGKFTHPPLGYIVHVPVSNGSLFRYFDGLTSPGRKFCTAWIAKDGSSEQYTTLDMKAWAQGDGNDDYWSFEVEGFPSEPMTDAQLDTLATWHTFLGVPDHIATAPGQTGIGTHQMGGTAWGGHSCPGVIRTAQLPQIIERAHATPQEDDMNTAEFIQLMKEAAERSTPAGRQLGNYLAAATGGGRAAAGVAQLLARDPGPEITAEEIAAAIPDGIAQAVAAELARRMES